MPVPIEDLIAKTLQAKKEISGPNGVVAAVKAKAAPGKLKKAVKGVGKEVQEFTIKSSAVDVAIGVLIGAAITPLVESLIKDVVIPPVALLFGGAELDTLHWVLKDGPSPGSYRTVEAAKKDGAVVIRYGAFVQAGLNALIIMVVTIIIIKLLNAIRREGGVVEYMREQASTVTKILGRLMGSSSAAVN